MSMKGRNSTDKFYHSLFRTHNMLTANGQFYSNLCPRIKNFEFAIDAAANG